MTKRCYSKSSMCFGESGGYCCRRVAQRMDEAVGGGLCHRWVAELVGEAVRTILVSGKKEVSLTDLGNCLKEMAADIEALRCHVPQGLTCRYGPLFELDNKPRLIGSACAARGEASAGTSPP